MSRPKTKSPKLVEIVPYMYFELLFCDINDIYRIYMMYIYMYCNLKLNLRIKLLFVIKRKGEGRGKMGGGGWGLFQKRCPV